MYLAPKTLRNLATQEHSFVHTTHNPGHKLHSLKPVESVFVQRCKANQDARNPQNNERALLAAIQAQQSLLTVLNDKNLTNLMNSNTFRSISQSFPLGAVLLSEPSIREIMVRAQLQNFESDTFHGFSDANGTPDLAVPVVFKNISSEAHLNRDQVALLAKIIRQLSQSLPGTEISKLLLLSPATNKSIVLNHLKNNFTALYKQTFTVLKRHLDNYSDLPLVLNLSKEADKALDHVLRTVVHNEPFLSLNELSHFADNQPARIQEVLATIKTDILMALIETTAWTVSSKSMINVPLSAENKDSIRQTMSAALQNSSPRDSNLNSQIAIAELWQRATEHSQPLLPANNLFEVEIDAKGIPYATRFAEVTLDEVMPFINQLFNGNTELLISDIMEAQTFSNPDYSRTALNQEIKIYLQEEVKTLFDQAHDFKSLILTSYLLTRFVDSSQLNQDLFTQEQDQAETKSVVKDFVSRKMSSLLDTHYFFDNQPAIIKQSSFGRDLYTAFFEALSEGTIALDANFDQSVNQLINTLAQKLLAERFDVSS